MPKWAQMFLQMAHPHLALLCPLLRHLIQAQESAHSLQQSVLGRDQRRISISAPNR